MDAFAVYRVSRCVLCGNMRYKLKVNRLLQPQRTYSEKTKRESTAVQENARPWKPVIGLEIHAQIQANTKLFSRSSSKYGAPTNTQVHFLDMALPGTLPVINKRCVEAGVLTALALNCRINAVSRFDRKHYFYADLPAGYQITQQKHALANDGQFTYIVYGRTHNDCVEKTAHITQLQLEQDSGKSVHEDMDNLSLIDLNRAGCALMEIVTEPDFHSAEDARSFVRDLRRALILIQTCDGQMAEGSLRVDANISVHKEGDPYGVRTEVKNLNSLNSVQKSINFEIKRQIKVLENGGQVVNETRSFDRDTGQTVSMRDKEVKQDYRFMPEPNLPPLHVFRSRNSSPGQSSSRVYIDELESQLPPLPAVLRSILIRDYECTLFQAGFIVNEGVYNTFVSLAKDHNSRKFRNFFIYHFVNNLILLEEEPDKCEIPEETLARLYTWFELEDLGQTSMTKVIELLSKDPLTDPKQILDNNNLWALNNEDTLRQICEEVLGYPEAKPAIKKHKNGKTKEAVTKLILLTGKRRKELMNIRKLSDIFHNLLSEKFKE